MTTYALPNDYEAWVLARADSGNTAPWNGTGPDAMAKPYGDMSVAMAKQDMHLNEALDRFDIDPGQRATVLFRVLAKRPDGPPPRTYGKTTIPDLPADAIPPTAPALSGHWLDTYIDYARAVSPMTPRSFHEAAGLWLISLVVARRLMAPITASGIFPNIFVMWIAPTTLYRKSTSLNIPVRLARQHFGHLLTPEDTNYERMLASFAGIEPSNLAKLDDGAQSLWKRSRDFAAQRGWALDEMSGLLANTGKEYNSGMMEALLRMYDCPEMYRKETQGQGLALIRNAYLSVLGASTPSAMATHLGNETLWGNGWWPRFAILTPDGARPDYAQADWAAPPSDMMTPLLQLDKQLGQPLFPEAPEIHTVTFESAVVRAWHAYNKALTYDLQTDELEPRLQGLYGRLPVQVIKVATLLAATDWVGNSALHAPRVGLAHYTRAVLVAESWRQSAHRAIADSRGTDYDVLRGKIARYVKGAGDTGMSYRDMAQAIRTVKSARELKDALEQMVDTEEIMEIASKATGTVGRPGKRYKWVRD